jgi:hypothetical protein
MSFEQVPGITTNPSLKALEINSKKTINSWEELINEWVPQAEALVERKQLAMQGFFDKFLKTENV